MTNPNSPNHTADRPVIVHFIGHLIAGGVELRALELLSHPSATTREHHVCITSGMSGTLDPQFIAAGAALHYMPIKSASFPWRLFRLLRKHAVDVVHSNLMHTTGYLLAIARVAGVARRIAHFQSDGTPATNRAQSTRRRVLDFLIAKNATDILALTESSMETAWSRNWRQDPRCQVITNGVPVPPESSRAPVPPELADQRDRYVVLHVGRGDLPTKNREKAISVLGELRQLGVDPVLVFIGRDGRCESEADSNRDRWLDLAAAHGVADRVIFVGERPNVGDYLLNSDVLLFTSRHEGMPGVVIEALAHGLPVVGSDIPGVASISHRLHGVRLVAPDAPDSVWASVLRHRLAETDDDERRAIAAGLRGSEFDLETAAKRYNSFWRI